MTDQSRDTMVTDEDPSASSPPPVQDPVIAPTARAGTIMRTIAVFGVVVAIVGTIVVWRFLGQLDRSVEQSLVIGEDAAVTLTETIEVADSLIDALDDGLITISATLGTIETAVGDTAGLAETSASLAGTLPDSFAEIDAALGTVQSLGGAVDSTLSALSQVPFGPDYDPAVPFPEAIGDVRAALAPIGDDLRNISLELAAVADGSGDLTAQIVGLEGDIEQTRTAVLETRLLLDDYRSAAVDARELASSSRDDLGTSITLTQWVVLLVGILLAVTQYLPWWLGTRLRRPV